MSRTLYLGNYPRAVRFHDLTIKHGSFAILHTLHIVRLQLDPADLEALVKYVQFSAIVPSPQLFSKTQQTPKLEAQDPDEDPLK